MFKNGRLIVLAMVLAALFSGCFFGTATLEKIVVSADVEQINPGESVALSVIGFDTKNKEMAVSDIGWLLSDDAKGTLESDGDTAVFTANEAVEGVVTIKVTSGELFDSIDIMVTKDANKTALIAKIETAQELKDSIGISEGEDRELDKAPEAAHTALQEAIDAADSVKANADATQAEVNDAVIALQTGIDAFNATFISSGLDRTGWTAKASDNSGYTGEALDGDSSSKWHGSTQKVDKWFELDMQSDQTFNLITLWDEPSPADLPRGFKVYVSTDGEDPEYGDPIFIDGFPEDHPNGIGEISLPSPETARWIKIVLTENASKYFAIHEIYVAHQ